MDYITSEEVSENITNLIGPFDSMLSIIEAKHNLKCYRRVTGCNSLWKTITQGTAQKGKEEIGWRTSRHWLDWPMLNYNSNRGPGKTAKHYKNVNVNSSAQPSFRGLCEKCTDSSSCRYIMWHHKAKPNTRWFHLWLVWLHGCQRDAWGSSAG